MRLLDLVEQYDGVGVTTYALCQLSAFLISHVSWRCTDQSRGVEALSIFAHVDTDQGVTATKHKLSQFLGEIGLTHTRRSEEHEHANRMVGILQSYTVALDGLHHLLDSCILTDNRVLQFLSHTLQTDTFLLSHPLGWYTCHHRDDLSHLFGIDHLTLLTFALRPTLVEQFQLCLEHRLTVSVASCEFEVLVSHCQLLFFFDAGNLLFLLSNLRWHLCITKMYARARLVEGVDGLIWHKAVCHIAVCQFDTCHERLVRIAHVVMLLVAVLDVMEYLQRLLVGRRLHLHLLESAFQCSVLLNRVTVFVERRGSDTLDGTTCQRRFHDVCCVHRTRSRTSSDDGVDLVDEYDDVRVRLELLHQCLQTFLELSAILRACYDTCHIECIDTLAEEHGTRVVRVDQLCQSFYDGALAHTRFTDQDGVVLLPASQDLDDALYLALAPYAGVELAFCSCLCQVRTEGVEYRCLRVGLLLGSRRGATGIVGRSRLATRLLVFIFILVGESDAVGHIIILRGEKHRHRVFIIHIVQF